ncbi:MAG: PHP domain-containing protein [Myxococcales bacterium]|nr:PHP domain-containing protein [Myxococcales bacterium]
MRLFDADLHVHTALSPCGADEMTPPAIVREARRRGLAMLAICDHNSARNVPAVRAAAGGDPVVLAGIEVTTAEEIHVLGLFGDDEAALATGEAVGATLPLAGVASRRHYGAQTVCDAEGRAVDEERRLLAAASGFPLGAAVELIRRHGGLVVACHLDRPSFSVFSQLGLWPADVRFDAIEISAADAAPPWREAVRALPHPVLRGSDAHCLDELGACRSRLRLAAPGFSEFALALRGAGGRGVA